MSAADYKQRLIAIIIKESKQIVRDRATLAIAFVLPIVLLVLFATAVNLDIKKVPIGILDEAHSPSSDELTRAFTGSDYFDVEVSYSRKTLGDALVSGKLDGYIVIADNFDSLLAQHSDESLVQVVTDGSDPNTANFVGNYAQAVVSGWLVQRSKLAMPTVQTRVWFNPEVESRRFLIPGAIGIVMTLIGTLLTALVVAREWERGTMEALVSTPARIPEILLGKLIPYFLLSLGAMVMSVLMAEYVFDVPFKGSWLAMMSLGICFTVPAIGQGLAISAVTKNQFVASIAAMLSGFLPAFLLSGFLFEVDSMPPLIQLITYLIPAKYFISSVQTVFLAGDIWSLFLPNMAAMLVLGGLIFNVARLKTNKRLDL